MQGFSPEDFYGIYPFTNGHTAGPVRMRASLWTLPLPRCTE
jgi:hypothetical protein